ncbi:ABC transporter ATP-binding protein [Sphingobacterium lumbrici]|uniref:ABC transporter ATP-binding protein n=1 Tax=Sphingobacterium lumbrici TaxID=2559600 RepID=UPI001128EFEF|nr:ABC transporter ATP-binding protein [Sphingobacterium lumbrici]
MNDSIIQLSGLTKRYGSLTAVDNLNLSIAKGEIYGLLGPNGAGKTTSILMMLGLTEPDEGTAHVCGHNATRNPIAVKKKVGYLPDSVGFYDNMTALENLRFIARLNGLSEAEAHTRSTEMLQTVGLAQAAHKKTATYSRGMKQRLGLADVLIKQPEVIILDEPTLGIDPSGVNEFLLLIKQLSREQGLTVLLSSHHLHQVQRVCDRVGIFVEGKLLVDGNIQTLAKDLLNKEGCTTTVVLQTVEEASLQQIKADLEKLQGFQTLSINDKVLELETTADITPEIVRTMVKHGADIIGVQRKEYSLDDIYEKYFEDH